MEQAGNPSYAVTVKSLPITQEESEYQQQEKGDCLSLGFISALSETVCIDTPQDHLTELNDIWGSWDLDKKAKFSEIYGDIALLLSVQVNFSFLRAIVSFWDPSYCCFTFNREDLTPTVKEYTALLRIPLVGFEKVYRKETKHMGVRKRLAKILSITDLASIEVVKRGEANHCVPWSYLRKYCSPEEPRSQLILALAIYGLVVFPRVPGHVEAAVVYLFEQLAKQVNPIPAILAETIRSLNHCRRSGRGRLIGCIPLLYIWARSHFWGVNNLQRRLHRLDFCPISEFNSAKWSGHQNKKQWIEVLRRVKPDDIT